MTKNEISAWYDFAMIIYADILFLFNALICYICLLCTAVLMKLPIRRIRVLAACIPGGAFSFIILVQINAVLSVLLKIVMCFLPVMIAFGKRKLRTLLSAVFLYFCMNVLLGGIVLLLSMKDAKHFYSNLSVSYVNISPALLLASLVVCYLCIAVIDKAVFRRRHRNAIYPTDVIVDGMKFSMFAFCDSGNHLTEPFSAFPVCVVKEGIIKNFDTMANKRIIPYSALGADGVLEAVKATVRVKDGKKMIINHQVYIACDAAAFRDVSYDMILNPKIFQTEDSNENYSVVE